MQHQCRALASGVSRALVQFWDVATGTVRATLKGHASHVVSLAFSPDGKLLACGSADQSISVLHAATGKLLLRLKVKAPVVLLRFSADGKTLHSVEANMASKQWDVATGQLLKDAKK